MVWWALLMRGLGLVVPTAPWLVCLLIAMVLTHTMVHAVHKVSNFRKGMLALGMDVPGQVGAYISDSDFAVCHHIVPDLLAQDVEPVHERLVQLVGATLHNDLQ